MIKKIYTGLLMLSAAAFAAQAQQPKAKASAAKRPDTPLVQTGYFGQPRKNVSAAIGTLALPAEQSPAAQNLKSSMQGRLAGVQVTQSNGMPSSETTVRVRGISSIFAETEPLYVVDGVAIYQGPRELPSSGPGAGWGSQFNPLTDLNVDDIATIDVLKDAGATAIYGARGANGVIVITTKRAKLNESQVSFNYLQGVTNATNRIDGLSGPQYLNLLDQSWQNSGQTGQGPLPATSGLTRAAAAGVDNNQLDKSLGLGTLQQIALSTSYSALGTAFYFSGSYRNEDGIVTGNKLNRFSGNMQVTNQITKRLMLGASVKLNFSNFNNMPVGYAPGGGFNAAQTNLPVYPFYNPNGTYFLPTIPGSYNIPGSNVAAFQDKREFDNKERTRRIFVSTWFKYNLAKYLSWNTTASTDLYYQTRTDYLSKRQRNGSIGSGTGREGVPTAYAAYEKYGNNLYNIKSTLNFEHLAKGYQLTALAGFELNYNENPYLFAEGEGYANDFARQPAFAGYRNTTTAQALTTNLNSFVSYFGHADLTINTKYLIGATLRYDGSSRFGANQKYAFFPAVSAGWLLTLEDFMKGQRLFSELKVRASYGQTGNLGIGNYTSLERWNLNTNSRYLLQPGIQEVSLGSPELRPERQTKLNLGIDFSLAGSRFWGTVDVYSHLTSNLLLQYNVPPSAGVTTPGLLLNAGKLRNSGVEVTLSSCNISQRNFNWVTTLVLTHNSNKVLDLGGLQPTQISTHPNIATYQDRPLGVFYLAEYAGVDPATGAELIIDASGNKVAATSAAQINAARKPQFDKPSAPKAFGGLNNAFQLHRFDLGVFASFQLGNYVLDEGERQLSYLRGNNNLRPNAVNAWTQAQPNTDFPKLVYNDPVSGVNTTRFLHNASYLRVKTLTLGYTFNTARKVKFIKKARLFVTGQNLFTMTGFKGWDPETLGNYQTNTDRSLNQGITYLDVPQIRTFAAGVSIKL